MSPKNPSQYTDEELLSFVLDDLPQEQKEEIQSLAQSNSSFATRINEIETLSVQLKAAPFHLSASPKKRKFALQFVFSTTMILLAFLLGLIVQNQFQWIKKSESTLAQKNEPGSKPNQNNPSVDGFKLSNPISSSNHRSNYSFM